MRKGIEGGIIGFFTCYFKVSMYQLLPCHRDYVCVLDTKGHGILDGLREKMSRICPLQGSRGLSSSAWTNLVRDFFFNIADEADLGETYGKDGCYGERNL